MRTILAGLVGVLFGTAALAQSATPEQKAQLAPTGALRAAIVMIPFLAKKDSAGQFSGVAPHLGDELAKQLGVPYHPISFDSPNAGIAALREGKADVTFLAPTPERLALIDFGPGFMGMEVTLIVPGSSTIQTLADADRPGKKIIVYEKTANDEMVRKTVNKATILYVPLFGWKKAFEMLKTGEADGYVDLRDQLVWHQSELPGSRIISGSYGRNAMAIGYVKDKPAAAAFVRAFTETATKSGFVTKSIERSGIHGAVVPGR
jgi:polar amino acid transport system substrate-binding protein